MRNHNQNYLIHSLQQHNSNLRLPSSFQTWVIVLSLLLKCNFKFAKYHSMILEYAHSLQEILVMKFFYLIYFCKEIMKNCTALLTLLNISTKLYWKGVTILKVIWIIYYLNILLFLLLIFSFTNFITLFFIDKFLIDPTMMMPEVMILLEEYSNQFSNNFVKNGEKSRSIFAKVFYPLKNE